MFATSFLSLTLLLGAAGPHRTVSETTHELVADPSSGSAAHELQLALRDLWAGHIFWVRSYVVASHYDDSAGEAAAETKVVENARAIADAIAPLYGKPASDQLFELLAGHYGAIKDYAAAVSQGAEAGQSAATRKLTENADAIATFLAAANPNLPKDAVLPLLVAHGGHHVQQIHALHDKDFTAEAVVWEAMRAHMNMVADALAGALVKQFPDKFAS